MRAALGLENGHTLSIENVEMLPPGPNDVIVKIGASGVCHTDVAILQGALPLPLPLILGHEGAGVVVEVGSQVTSLAVGDKVIGSVGAVCGHCWHCNHGMTHHCDNSAVITMGPKKIRRANGDTLPAFVGLGTFAEAMTAHETSLVKVQTDLPDEQLALIGCAITSGLGAVFNTAKVTPGASVAVVGCGGVGQAVIQGARIAGAGRIIAIDPVAKKREAAIKFGATDAIDPTETDPVEYARSLTGGRGVDFAFEVVGKPATILQTWDLARKAGTVTLVGMPAVDATVTLPAFALSSDDKRLLGSLYGGTQARRDIPLIVELAETGRLDLGSMITRRLLLDEVNDAVRALEAGEEIRSVLI
ncbi:Zn-dependent alcohol dehydrogenase [Rhizobium tropici]|uniref:Zn-dependent alcohol dehydrogenase n=1 Tax=Rhizobium tropici TaxID=398 RepID=A0A5B0VR15_RHITR|nr:Zn-dependent alcohol dehydrogenase [Rhizobium tropici]KAA1176973.1 Zn-dependent alcohol dehydrogenase [Rhizobium tropici]